MKRIFLLHDLESDSEELKQQLPENALVFAAKPSIRHCLGCFGCWLKTPGTCVLKDRAQITPALLASCSELLIVSRLVYGGFSPEIKRVLDRSIGYLLPFFQIKNNEMHHFTRYENALAITAHFYCDGPASAAEQAVARKLLQANMVNLGAVSARAIFHNAIPTLKEVLV